MCTLVIYMYIKIKNKSNYLRVHGLQCRTLHLRGRSENFVQSKHLVRACQIQLNALAKVSAQIDQRNAINITAVRVTRKNQSRLLLLLILHSF